ncbi:MULTISPECIES: sulfatase [Haloarcula]|uniref:sulfatase n=1 Tax=Haloarcula TaxID=2237 RepID=UPI0023EDD04F|nr:sulfatase [Halomicroarcula sp. XH51]
MAKNVLLLTIDSLRGPPFLSTNTRSHLTSFDRLRDADGVSFSNAFATGPTTRTSFPALMTGTYALSDEDYPTMSPDRPFLAETLADRGYATAGFTSNPFLSRAFNYDTGFQTFHDHQSLISRKGAKMFPDGIERPRGFLNTLDGYFPITRLLKGAYSAATGQSRPYRPASTHVDETVSFIDDCEEPFFCWTHFMDAHHPCFPPLKYRRTQDVSDNVDLDRVAAVYSRFVDNYSELTTRDVTLLRQLYRASIAYLDDEVNRLLDEIAARDALEETAVVLTSDHGELYGEHGEYDKPPRLYDELLHVPLVVSNATSLLQERRDGLVSLIDIPPLIHHLLDEPINDAYRGYSVKNLPRSFVIGEEFRRGKAMVSVRSAEYRYEVDDIRGRSGLHEVGLSASEISPSTVDSGILTELRRQVQSHRERIRTRSAEIDVSNEVEERLKDLGYLNDP